MAWAAPPSLCRTITLEYCIGSPFVVAVVTAGWAAAGFEGRKPAADVWGRSNDEPARLLPAGRFFGLGLERLGLELAVLFKQDLDLAFRLVQFFAASGR